MKLASGTLLSSPYLECDKMKNSDFEAASHQQLTALVTQFTGLTSLRYSLLAPFPTLLLRHLAERQHCALEIGVEFLKHHQLRATTSSTSTNYGSSEDEAIAQDIELLSSASLRRVGLLRISDQYSPSLEPASSILRGKVGSLAPNIEPISVMNTVHPHPLQGQFNLPLSKRFAETCRDSMLGPKKKMKELSLMMQWTVIPKPDTSLETWDRILDFSQLETLRLCQVDCSMPWLTSQCRFPALQHLVLVHDTFNCPEYIATISSPLGPCTSSAQPHSVAAPAGTWLSSSTPKTWWLSRSTTSESVLKMDDWAPPISVQPPGPGLYMPRMPQPERPINDDRPHAG